MKESINGDRIYLAFPIGKVSAEVIHECMKNDNTSKFISSAPYPYTIDSAAAFLKYIEKTESNDSIYEYGIFSREDDSFIGMIALENIDTYHKKCEIGYWLSEKYFRKGIASEACKLLIKFAFSKLEMNKITAFAIKENAPSISLLIRLGFEIEGLLRDDVINRGQFADRYALGLLKSKYISY